MKNSAKGKVYYGLHFYPGVASYAEPGRDPLMVFLNEDTIRDMDPSFAGCPVFVRHVNEVSDNISEVKDEADGWVMESFFNDADGKHWVKFVAVSEKAEKAIAQGWQLSNCYMPEEMGAPGRWNGIDYDRQINSGKYEHLAIVPDPRYEESVIMTPEKFKEYNRNKKEELLRLANNKGAISMLSFFQKKKVENANALDIENTIVVLPKSKLEVAISKLINEADEKEMKGGDPMEAHPDHHVMINGEKMKVGDLMDKYKDCMNELLDMKKIKDDDEESDGGDEESMDNEDDEEDDEDKKMKKNALDEAAAIDREIEEQKIRNAQEKKVQSKAKADKLRNAAAANDKTEMNKFQAKEQEVLMTTDRVALGKKLY